MKRRTKFIALGVFSIFLSARFAAAQEPPTIAPAEEGKGYADWGVRTYWGSVYGRPDLPFKPDLGTSKLNEYSDIRNNLFLRRAYIRLDDLLGANNYLNYQTKGSFYKNQSHLVTAGQYGKYKALFRSD